MTDDERLLCEGCGRLFHKKDLLRCKECGAILCRDCGKVHPCVLRANEMKIVNRPSKRNVSHKIILVVVAIIIALAIFFAVSGLIPQYPHIVEDTSAMGSKTITSSFPFLDGMESITVTIPSSIYVGAMKENSHNIPSSMIDTQEYYYYYTNDPLQEEMYSSILNQMEAIRQKHGLTSDEYVELLSTYAQSLTYDEYALDYPRYPVQTVIDKRGDCDETSMLLAGLLSRAGYDVVLLSFDAEEHMTVGIRAGESYAYPNSDGYAIIETTGYSYVTDSSSELEDVGRLYSTPVVIEIGDGVLTYSSGYQVKTIVDYINRVSPYIDSSTAGIDSTKSQISVLSDKIDGYERQLNEYNSQLEDLNRRESQGSISYEEYSKQWDIIDAKYDALYQTYSSAIDEYNRLVNEVNSDIDKTNNYVDAYNLAISEPYNRQYVYDTVQRYPLSIQI